MVSLVDFARRALARGSEAMSLHRICKEARAALLRRRSLRKDMSHVGRKQVKAGGSKWSGAVMRGSLIGACAD